MRLTRPRRTIVYAGRCRVVGGHAPLNCDQYEAQRGHEDVCKCPGCGVYIVKGDGEKGRESFSKRNRFSGRRCKAIPERSAMHCGIAPWSYLLRRSDYRSGERGKKSWLFFDVSSAVAQPRVVEPSLASK